MVDLLVTPHERVLPSLPHTIPNKRCLGIEAHAGDELKVRENPS